MILKLKKDKSVYQHPELNEQTLRYVNSAVIDSRWHILIQDENGLFHDIPAGMLETVTKLDVVLE